MADGGNHPAARTLRPPANFRENGVSGARLAATPKPYMVPPSLGRPSQNAPASAPVLAETPPPLATAPSNDAPPPTMKEASVPRLAQRPGEASASEASQPAVASAWGEFATAPTLLVTPRDDADADDAAATSRMFTPSTSDDGPSTSRFSAPTTGDDGASTSRIATPSTPPLEDPLAPRPDDPPWYRTGLTVPPPSMRPPAESASAVRNAPSPRVLKLVAGVFGGCLFIVAIAGVKVLYKRAMAPADAPIETTATLAHPADPPSAAAVPSEGVAAAALPGDTREAPAAATPAPEVHRSAPARTTRSPAKTAPRRAPATKKAGKSTH